MDNNKTQLLPQNTKGRALYCPDFLPKSKAAEYFNRLKREIPWETEVIKMFGKTHYLTRKTAWFADGAKSYTYAGTNKRASPWIDVINELKHHTEVVLGQRFNSCLANFYSDGNSGMGWHSDNEKEIDQEASIASLSFGAERKFAFKHKLTKHKVDFELLSGSLLEMQAGTQQQWLHALPKSKKIKTARINLTFRKLSAV